MNLQDSAIADEADPPTRSSFLYHGLDLSQYLPELPESRLFLAIDRNKIVFTDLALRDGEECAGSVNGEVMIGCVGEVELGICLTPIKLGSRDL